MRGWAGYGLPICFSTSCSSKAHDVRSVELIGRRRMLRNGAQDGGRSDLGSQHLEAEDGPAMYRHACATGLGASCRSGSRADLGFRCGRAVGREKPAR